MINHLDELRRRRQEGFLSVMLSIEKSHVPFADEPGIYFPPLATWKAIEKLRKDKYEVSSLPNDDEGREDAKKIQRLLEEVIETQGLPGPDAAQAGAAALLREVRGQGQGPADPGRYQRVQGSGRLGQPAMGRTTTR